MSAVEVYAAPAELDLKDKDPSVLKQCAQCKINIKAGDDDSKTDIHGFCREVKFNAACCCFCSYESLEQAKINPCTTCAFRLSSYRDRLENARKSRNMTVALMRAQRSVDVADTRLLFEILHEHRAPEDAEMTLPFRAFLATDAGVQTLLTPEGMRWMDRLDGLLDFSGIDTLVDLASLQPLADCGYNKVREVRLSDCKKLRTLGSIEALMDLHSITRLCVDGCPELLFPPPEIARRDGAAVITFLRHRIMDLKETSLIGKELPLFGAMKRHRIVELDVSSCPKLKELPIDDICTISTLKALRCNNSPKLDWPPQCVAALGGEKALECAKTGKVDMSPASADIDAFPDPSKLNHWRINAISIASCARIQFIPVEPLLAIPSLTSLECQSTSLAWPPLNVIAKGGIAVMDFLRSGVCDLEPQPGLAFPDLTFLSEAHIRHLNLARAFGATSPPQDSMLPVCTSLESLSAVKCTWITDASFLAPLKHVRKINLSGCSLLGPVIPPEVFDDLLNLTEIVLDGCKALVYPPPWVIKLGPEVVATLLRHKRLDLRKSEWEDMPPEIEGLGVYDLAEIDVSSCHNLRRLPVPMLCGMTSLVSLVLADCPKLPFPPAEMATRGGRAAMRFLRERRLELRESNMEYIDEAMLLCIRESCVLEVDLSDCKKLKEIPVDALCEMEHLERLELKRCDSLKWPPIQVINRGSTSVMHFLKDGRLDLTAAVTDEFPDLVEMCRFRPKSGKEGGGTSIVEVDITNCKKLVNLPYRQLIELESLEALHCRGCEKLRWPPQNVIAMGGNQVMNYLRARCWDLSSRGEDSELPAIDPELMNLACIETIDMSNNSKLWKLPYEPLLSITTLTCLEIRNCQHLQFPPAWVGNLGGERVWRLVKDKVLDLSGQDGVTSLPDDLVSVLTRSKAKEVDVSRCKLLKLLPCEPLAGVQSLSSVTCSSCDSLTWPPVAVREAGGKTTMTFIRERKLDLSGSNIEQMPDLQAFMGASIREVDLTDCARLTAIPVEQLILLPELFSIEVRGCDSLRYPPRSVRDRGGIIVWQFLRERQLDWTNFNGTEIAEEEIEALAEADLISINLTGSSALSKVCWHAFSRLTTLKSLCAKDCPSLTFPPTCVRDKLSPERTLKFVLFREYDVSELPITSLDSGLAVELAAAGVSSIDATGCTKLENVDGDAFARITSLASLSLGGCSALSWPHDVIVSKGGHGVVSYIRSRRYDLSGSEFKAIPEGLLEELDGAQVAVLDLTDCTMLERLPMEQLASMTSLTSLPCSGCPVLDWPPPLVKDRGGAAVSAFIRARKLDLPRMDFDEMPLQSELALPMASNFLVEIDVSHCKNLKKIPIQTIVSMRSLESFACVGCPLITPPANVRAHGGKAVVAFLRDLVEDGVYVRRISACFVGPQGGGKSTLIRQLLGEQKVRVRRGGTVGVVEAGTLEPEEEDVEIDLIEVGGGGDVYARSCALLLPERCLFVMVYSASSGPETASAQVSSWLTLLAARHPGCSVILLCGHSDEGGAALASSAALKAANKVPNILVVSQQTISATACDGIDSFRDLLIERVMGLKWYDDQVPRSWTLMQSNLRGSSDVEGGTEKRWMEWDEYCAAALALGVREQNIVLCTDFLLESGYIFMPPGSGEKGRIYFDFGWVRDVVRGVARHDWRFLVGSIGKEGGAANSGVKALIGGSAVLERAMLPFIWPTDNEFWGVAREDPLEWGGVWGGRDSVIASRGDEDAALKLLQDMLVISPLRGKSDTWVVPSMLRRATGADGSAFSAEQGANSLCLRFPILPGAVNCAVVSLMCRDADVTRVEASTCSSVFYYTGRALQVMPHTDGATGGPCLTVRASSHPLLMRGVRTVRDALAPYPGVPSHTLPALALKDNAHVGSGTVLVMTPHVIIKGLSAETMAGRIMHEKRSGEAHAYWNMAERVGEAVMGDASLKVLAAYETTDEEVYSGSVPPCVVCVIDQSLGKNRFALDRVKELSSKSSSVLCVHLGPNPLASVGWWPGPAEDEPKSGIIDLTADGGDARLRSCIAEIMLAWRLGAGGAEGVLCVPCPKCVETGSTPPHPFPRQECWDDMATSTGAASLAKSVSCPACKAAGRFPRIKLSQIVPPQIIISHAPGDGIARGAADELGKRTGLLVWCGPSSATSEPGSHEILSAIQSCTAFIPLLSDAYLSNPGCMREASHAQKWSKLIVPALSSGWSGSAEPGDKNPLAWSKHAGKQRIGGIKEAAASVDWSRIASEVGDTADMRSDDLDAPLSHLTRLALGLLNSSVETIDCSDVPLPVRKSAGEPSSKGTNKLIPHPTPPNATSAELDADPSQDVNAVRGGAPIAARGGGRRYWGQPVSATPRNSSSTSIGRSQSAESPPENLKGIGSNQNKSPSSFGRSMSSEALPGRGTAAGSHPGRRLGTVASRTRSAEDDSDNRSGKPQVKVQKELSPLRAITPRHVAEASLAVLKDSSIGRSKSSEASLQGQGSSSSGSGGTHLPPVHGTMSKKTNGDSPPRSLAGMGIPSPPAPKGGGGAYSARNSSFKTPAASFQKTAKSSKKAAGVASGSQPASLHDPRQGNGLGAGRGV